MAYTTPATWVAGDVLTAAQLNAQLRDNLLAAFPLGVDAWTAYTPTLTQLGAVTKTVTYAKYQRVGRIIIAQVQLAITGAGTAANAVSLSLPVTAAAAGSMIVGVGQIYDASVNAGFKGLAYLNTTTTCLLAPTNTTTAGALGGDTFTAALASGDSYSVSLTYEAAT